MPTSPEIVAHIDGGSRGNPGPAAYGVTIETVHGQPLTAFGKYIGKTTNNVAEYQGLLAALEYALNHGHPRLRVMTDSELMARQISGRYKVRSPDLKPLHDKARAMIASRPEFDQYVWYLAHVDNSVRAILYAQLRDVLRRILWQLTWCSCGAPQPGCCRTLRTTISFRSSMYCRNT